ncbi:levan regulatory domain protein, partial [Klebsiella pneumoniae]
MNVKKRFTSVRLLYTVNIYSGCTYSVACGVIGGKMQDYFLESLKLQRIDFFL